MTTPTLPSLSPAPDLSALTGLLTKGLLGNPDLSGLVGLMSQGSQSLPDLGSLTGQLGSLTQSLTGLLGQPAVSALPSTLGLGGLSGAVSTLPSLPPPLNSLLPSDGLSVLSGVLGGLGR